MPLKEDVERRMKQFYPSHKSLFFSRKEPLNPNNVYKDAKKALNIMGEIPLFWIIIGVGALVFFRLILGT